MTENGWQAIGRIAKQRRERLGLRQDELAEYGGPKVATVGKFERGVATFPPRTQQQIEVALGWTRGVIADFIKAVEDNEDYVTEWESDLIDDDIPDLARPKTSNGDRTFEEAVEALTAVMRLVEPDRIDEATRAAILAIAPKLTSAGAELAAAAVDDTAEGGDGNADTDAGGPTSTKMPLSVVTVELPAAAKTGDIEEPGEFNT